MDRITTLAALTVLSSLWALNIKRALIQQLRTTPKYSDR
jgi:hypothetical protein